MKNILITAAILVICGLALGAVLEAQSVTSGTPYSFSVTGTLANCPAVSTILSGQAVYCDTITGPYFAASGATAYTSLLPGAVAAPQLTINGTTKTLPATFTIIASAPTIGAPVVTTGAPVSTASAPSATAPVVTAN